jgi:hypothetical protein
MLSPLPESDSPVWLAEGVVWCQVLAIEKCPSSTRIVSFPCDTVLIYKKIDLRSVSTTIIHQLVHFHADKLTWTLSEERWDLESCGIVICYKSRPRLEERVYKSGLRSVVNNAGGSWDLDEERNAQ